MIMNNDNPLENDKERLAVLGSLVSQRVQQGSEACPADDQLAAFVENRLSGPARAAMLDHLDRCPSCYRHWLEVADLMDGKLRPSAPAVPDTTPAPAKRLLDWLYGDWIAIPIAAAAALAYVVVTPLNAPNASQLIDASYTAFLQKEKTNAAPLLASAPTPEGTGLAFSDAPPTAPRQAFKAGLDQGRREAATNAEKDQREHDAAAAYFELGRWIVLAWAQSRSETRAVNWAAHQQSLDALLGELDKLVESQDEARIAIAAINRLRTEVATLAKQDDAAAKSALARGLELTIQQLAP